MAADTNHSMPCKLPWRWRAITFLAVIASCILALYSAKHRIPWSDEGFFSSAASNLALHGYMGTTVKGNHSELTRIAQHTYWILPLFLVGEAGWYLVFPNSVLSTRAYNLPFAILLLWGFYTLISHLLYDRKIAAAATSLLALSYIFIDNAGFARPDLMCCAFGISALGVYVRNRERSFAAALLTGSSFAALAVFTHPNGIYHVAGLALLVSYYDRRKVTARAVAAAVSPWLVLSAAYAIYVARDPQAFLDQMRINGTNGRWTTTLNPFRILYDEIAIRHFTVFGLVTRGASLPKVIALLAYATGIAGLCFTKSLRAQQGVRTVLALTGVSFIGLAVFNQKLSVYMIHIVPYYVATFTIWAWYTYSKGTRRIQAAIIVFVAVLVLVEASGIVIRARRRSYIGAERALISFLQEHASPEAKIFGSASLSYGLNFDPRLVDDPYLGTRSGEEPDLIVLDEQLYDVLYNTWSSQGKEQMPAILARVASYGKIFDNRAYRVYVRPNAQSLGRYRP